LLLGGWLALGAGARAGEDMYFAVVFGAQRPLLQLPRYTHSFATFAHLDPAGRLEAFTISWLPSTAEVRVLRLQPEPGHNYTLAQTLKWCRDNRMQVARVGSCKVGGFLVA
jgi:hypothetical protein